MDRYILVNVYDTSWTMKGSGSVTITLISGVGYSTGTVAWTGNANEKIKVGNNDIYPTKVSISVKRDGYLSPANTYTLSYDSSGIATISYLQSKSGGLSDTTGRNKYYIKTTGGPTSILSTIVYYKDVSSTDESWITLNNPLSSSNGITILTTISAIKVDIVITDTSGNKYYGSSRTSYGSTSGTTITIALTTSKQYYVDIYTYYDNNGTITELTGCSGAVETNVGTIEFSKSDNYLMCNFPAVRQMSSSLYMAVVPNNITIVKSGYNNFEYTFKDGDFNDFGRFTKKIVLYLKQYEVYGYVIDYISHNGVSNKTIRITNQSGYVDAITDSNGYWRYCNTSLPKLAAPIANQNIYFNYKLGTYSEDCPRYDFIYDSANKFNNDINNSNFILPKIVIGNQIDRKILIGNSYNSWYCPSKKNINNLIGFQFSEISDKLPTKSEFTTQIKNIILNGAFSTSIAVGEYVYASYGDITTINDSGDAFFMCLGKIVSVSSSKIEVDATTYGDVTSYSDLIEIDEVYLFSNQETISDLKDGIQLIWEGCDIGTITDKGSYSYTIDRIKAIIENAKQGKGIEININ